MNRAVVAKICTVIALVAVFAAAAYFAGDLPRSGVTEVTGTPTTEAPFPRTARDYHGDELTIPAPPERIASQALVTDEFLFSLVPRDRMVAVSRVAHDPRYSHVAEIVKDLPVEIISDPEPVLRRNPDLLLVAHTARADYVELVRAAGVPTFRLLTLFETFDQIADGLGTTGYLTGEDAAARREVETLRARIEAAKKRRRDNGPVRVLAFSSFSFSYGKGSLFDHIVNELGAINVGAEQGLGPYGKIGSEQVAAWNPDWIVAGADKTTLEDVRTRLLADPGVSVTVAGRRGQVLVLENVYYLSMSQHAAGLMEQLAEAIYPERL